MAGAEDGRRLHDHASDRVRVDVDVPMPENVARWTSLLLKIRGLEAEMALDGSTEINGKSVDFSIYPMALNKVGEPFITVIDFSSQEEEGKAVVVAMWQNGKPDILTSDTMSDCDFSSGELLDAVIGEVRTQNVNPSTLLN